MKLREKGNFPRGIQIKTFFYFERFLFCLLKSRKKIIWQPAGKVGNPYFCLAGRESRKDEEEYRDGWDAKILCFGVDEIVHLISKKIKENK